MQKIVIIGAGPAGLTAAYELLGKSNDVEITILEQSGEIGGISKTVKYNQHFMDIGGHRFFSKDQRVMEFWKELMPLQGAPSFDDIQLGREKPLAVGGPDPEQENDVMLVRNRVSRIYYNHKFFDYPVSMKWDTFKNMGLVTSVVAGFSYLKAAMFKREETSLENFYINRFGKKLYAMFFEGYTEKLWGRHPREISADWGAQRVKGLSIVAIIKDIFSKIFGRKNRKVETSLIEEFYYPKYGPGHLWEKLARECEQKGATIVMNASVNAICSNGQAVSGVCYHSKGETVTLDADVVISSMPLKDMVMSLSETPKDIVRIAEGLPYRDFVTVGILVNKLKLENKTKLKTLANIVPDCWIYIQDCSVKLGRVQIFNNWSPYLVKNPMETVWIGTEYFCNENDDFWNLSDQEGIAFAVQELIKIGMIDNADEVLDAHREKVQKAYPAYFDTYDEIDTVIDYIEGVENLYCVGRNGQHRYNNMDHSMATAFETVDNIINHKKGKANIWSVNTEQDYHEEKQENE